MIVMGTSLNAKNFYESAEKIVTSLYERWQDEKAYENIGDYAAALHETAIATGVVIEKMTKKPFGVVFTCDDRTYQLYVKRSGRVHEYSYKRIK